MNVEIAKNNTAKDQLYKQLSYLLRSSLGSILNIWLHIDIKRIEYMNHSPIGLLLEKIDILVPLRRPLSYFSKAAFVTNLKAEVKAPDAATPAEKDCT